MNLSPKSFLTTEDMEDFASEYLGLKGTDADMFYESYYALDNQYDEDEYRDELNQTKWEYWQTNHSWLDL